MLYNCKDTGWQRIAVHLVRFPTPTMFAYRLQCFRLNCCKALFRFINSYAASLAGVMGNVAGVMKKVNDSVNTEETAKIMQQFAVENEKMNMSEEMMDDALIDAVREQWGNLSFFRACEASTSRARGCH